MKAEDEDESLARALADVELVAAAYPEVEVEDSDSDGTQQRDFPIRLTLRFEPLSYVLLELTEGYPTTSSIQIVSYRSNNNDKSRVEFAVSSIRQVAQECLEDGIESGFACCAAGLESWNDFKGGRSSSKDVAESNAASGVPTEHAISSLEVNQSDCPEPQNTPPPTFRWVSGDPLLEKKSVFQAHVCRIACEADVRLALHQLIDGNSKLQRATHNMWAYRVREQIVNPTNKSGVSVILKHDNDDDGEDAAGGRLAHLLDMRDDEGVFVVVSRWYGGIQLGPRRFALINNVAREVLEQFKASNNHQG